MANKVTDNVNRLSTPAFKMLQEATMIDKVQCLVEGHRERQNWKGGQRQSQLPSAGGKGSRVLHRQGVPWQTAVQQLHTHKPKMIPEEGFHSLQKLTQNAAGRTVTVLEDTKRKSVGSDLAASFWIGYQRCPRERSDKRKFTVKVNELLCEDVVKKNDQISQTGRKCPQKICLGPGGVA